MRVSHRGYLRATQGAFVALYLIIITGSLVRLTGSGLGCADWPQCSESKFIDVSSTHAAIEQINRLFTGVVAASVILCVLLSLRLKPKRRDLIAMSIVLVAGVMMQVVIGAIVVWTGLNPFSNIAHFLVSIFLMTTAYMLVRHASIFRTTDEVAPRGEPLLNGQPIEKIVKTLLVATGAAVVTGTLVTGSGPHAGDETAVRLGFAMPTIVRTHSAFVWLTVGILLVSLHMTRKNTEAKKLLMRPLKRFAAVVLFQGAIGYLQYFLGVPIGLVAIHVATSVAVWLCALDVYWSSRLSALPNSVLD
ncbi:MAG: COX15/CtaA family protein [Ilumatobacteraceae bacterium]|nr:COX15/CtaA family protein [Ilumatobacteraceae bacterium]